MKPTLNIYCMCRCRLRRSHTNAQTQLDSVTIFSCQLGSSQPCSISVLAAIRPLHVDNQSSYPTYSLLLRQHSSHYVNLSCSQLSLSRLFPFTRFTISVPAFSSVESSFATSSFLALNFVFNIYRPPHHPRSLSLLCFSR